MDVDVDVSWHCPSVTTMVTMCQDHVQLRSLIRLLWSHHSTVAQLQSSAHNSSTRRTHNLPLRATLCIRLNPVVTTLPHLPCCTVSSLCSVYIPCLVVFSLDLTYFHRTCYDHVQLRILSGYSGRIAALQLNSSRSPLTLVALALIPFR